MPDVTQPSDKLADSAEEPLTIDQKTLKLLQSASLGTDGTGRLEVDGSALATSTGGVGWNGSSFFVDGQELAGDNVSWGGSQFDVSVPSGYSDSDARDATRTVLTTGSCSSPGGSEGVTYGGDFGGNSKLYVSVVSQAYEYISANKRVGVAIGYDGARMTYTIYEVEM